MHLLLPVAPVTLTWGSLVLGVPLAVLGERPSDIDLVLRELPFFVSAYVPLITRVWFDHFAIRHATDLPGVPDRHA